MVLPRRMIQSSHATAGQVRLPSRSVGITITNMVGEKIKVRFAQIAPRRLAKLVTFFGFAYASAGLSMLATVVLARHLGPGGFGIYSYGVIYAVIAMNLVQYTRPNALVRDVIQNDHPRRILAAVIIIRLAIALLILTGATAWLLFQGEQSITLIVALLMLCSGIAVGFANSSACFCCRLARSTRACV